MCELSDDIKAKLDDIYNEGDKMFIKFSDGHDWHATQYEPLGVSEKDWLLFVCDKMGIIDICV